MEDAAKLARELEEARASGLLCTVGLVIRSEGALLILKRRSDDFMPNLWEVPGGHIEAGESLEAAARRELREETGWRLGGFGPLVNRFDYDGEGARTREWNFVAHAVMDAPLRHPEHQAHRWVTRATYRRYPMTPEMRNLVARVLEENAAAGPAGR